MTTKLEITRSNGSTLTVERTVGKRAWQLHPVEQRESLIRKFTALTRHVLGPQRTVQIIEAVFALKDEDNNIRNLTRLLGQDFHCKAGTELASGPS